MAVFLSCANLGFVQNLYAIVQTQQLWAEYIFVMYLVGIARSNEDVFSNGCLGFG
jgi:hypothetical protein